MINRPDLLAHSAPEAGRDPQPYEEHVLSVARGATRRAKLMLSHCRDRELADRLLASIDFAARFHDLGKLDPDNQAALHAGRSGAMKWDHVDAGVAQAIRSSCKPAAWIIRAHHRPGLPARILHFGDQKRGLRGGRDDEINNSDLVARTDGFLEGYLRDHVSAVGAAEARSVGSIFGLALRFGLSAVVDADHSDSARFDTGINDTLAPAPRWKERIAALDAYVDDLGRRASSGSRSEKRASFYKICCNAEFSEPIVACSAAVGIGKTTAVPAYLLRIAMKKELRRLFIIAPYTNIISQTVNILRASLTLEDEDPEEVVVAHHHRAEFSDRRNRDLTLLWQAPIVVTTAVQFFETLSANTPAALRKLHALPGSAIFIDEAHAALPAHLWRQNWSWLRELADVWNCRIVLASGSLARFWENDRVVCATETQTLPDMVPAELGKGIMLDEARRVVYRRAGRLGLTKSLVDRVLASPGPRLVVLNTVRSAAIVARAMRERLGGNAVFHLSTALAPQDRDRVLEKIIAALASRNPDIVVVATSCVEAGVDLSFRTAFRERFSAASLIQIAGRVNRHGEMGEECVVYDFTDDGEGTLNPQAKFSSPVLAEFLKEGAFDGLINTSDLITRAMAEEIEVGPARAVDPLAKAEAEQNFPAVAEAGKVINVDTRTVVVDPDLFRRLRFRGTVPFRELQKGSVQIWMSKISELNLREIEGCPGLYHWPYAYESDFLGYMAGALTLADFERKGFVSV